MLFTETVYAVWMQRNNKMFRGSCMAINHVMKVLFLKSLLDVKLGIDFCCFSRSLVGWLPALSFV